VLHTVFCRSWLKCALNMNSNKAMLVVSTLGALQQQTPWTLHYMVRVRACVRVCVRGVHVQTNGDDKCQEILQSSAAAVALSTTLNYTRSYTNSTTFRTVPTDLSCVLITDCSTTPAMLLSCPPQCASDAGNVHHRSTSVAARFRA
jgi:hypothetical protein